MSCAGHLPSVDLSRVTATSILSAEHQVILQVLDVLGKLASKAAADGEIPAAHARQALDVLRRFADECHHGKEEHVLFPRLESIAPGFGPTQVMRAEHVEGRALIAGMGRALEAGDAATFAAAARGYSNLLRAHIMKEDDILFRLAGQMLTPAQDAELVEAYRRIEHDEIGEGTHERMLGLADALALTYGVRRASDDPRVSALLTAVCGCRADVRQAS